MTLAFGDELRGVLLQTYLENRTEIRHILSQMTMGLAQYHNLEWRLDIQVNLCA